VNDSGGQLILQFLFFFGGGGGGERFLPFFFTRQPNERLISYSTTLMKGDMQARNRAARRCGEKTGRKKEMVLTCKVEIALAHAHHYKLLCDV